MKHIQRRQTDQHSCDKGKGKRYIILDQKKCKYNPAFRHYRFAFYVSSVGIVTGIHSTGVQYARKPLTLWEYTVKETIHH
jgi:hypothetical protein